MAEHETPLESAEPTALDTILSELPSTREELESLKANYREELFRLRYQEKVGMATAETPYKTKEILDQIRRIDLALASQAGTEEAKQ